MKTAKSPKRRPSILVIDDDSGIRETVQVRLELSGFEVKTASAADEAFLLLKSWKPDLILLDVSMPKMDGFEVCKVLKENKDTSSIPVIFLTGAGGEMETQLQSLMVGAVDYVCKPFEGEELVARLRLHLPKSMQGQT